MRLGGDQTIDRPAFGHRQTGCLQDVFGAIFSHRQCRGEHARMGVGNPEHFEDALDDSVLAEWAMQRIESDIGLEISENLPNVSIDIDLGDLKPLFRQRLGASGSEFSDTPRSAEIPAHQDGNVLFH